MSPTTNDENQQPGPNAEPGETAAAPDPGFLDADKTHKQDGPRRDGSGGEAPHEELVDVSREDGETIRTLRERPLPDGSGNDSADPEERPDEGDERYDAG